jgi:hypothetical protein
LSQKSSTSLFTPNSNFPPPVQPKGKIFNLVPRLVHSKEKSNLLKNKEPKFVPFEPCKFCGENKVNATHKFIIIWIYQIIVILLLKILNFPLWFHLKKKSWILTFVLEKNLKFFFLTYRLSSFLGQLRTCIVYREIWDT